MREKDSPTNISHSLDCLSTSALKLLVYQDLENNSPDALSPDTLKYIFELLDSREHCDAEPDIAEEWKRFKRESIPLVTQGYDLSALKNLASPCITDADTVRRWPAARRSPKQTIRTIAATAAAICILFTGMITVQASGFDVFGAIARWTDETFNFAVSSSNIGVPNNTASREYQESVGDILDFYNVKQSLVPSWYPQGYTMSEPEIYSSEGVLQIFCSFENQDGGYFSIQIFRYENTEELNNYTFEKSSGDAETFTENGKIFYILRNEDTLTGTWTDGHTLESISGNLSEQDLKNIIKSIGG